MAPATRTQAVYDPQTGEHKTFEVINITDQVQAGLQQREADRKALREKIYGTAAKAEESKPTKK